MRHFGGLPGSTFFGTMCTREMWVRWSGGASIQAPLAISRAYSFSR